ncbi:DUF4919 domain-containing protein [Flavobacterium sp. RHBU_3]|uniref:DUF4919 domain-containing protein n=1 Tax=Flavobacterium sp. RHBU_3 TaxID=3391184 RepID=UPI003984737D
MKKLFTTLMLLVMIVANAQEIQKPDYNSIEQNIHDSASKYYYPKLFGRYKKADTTLTLEEARHLYYGSAYIQAPVSTEEAVEALQKLNGILAKSAPTQADCLTALEYTDVILAYEPFSLTVKQYRMACYRQLGRYDEAILERTQCEIIADAILSSGDGTTKDRSIHVLDTDNEMEVLSLMGFKPAAGDYAVTGNHDYITLQDNAYRRPGVYFYINNAPVAVSGL